jgi:hypothetical protein
LPTEQIRMLAGDHEDTVHPDLAVIRDLPPGEGND